MVSPSLIQATSKTPFTTGLQTGANISAQAQAGKSRAAQLALQRKSLEFRQEQLDAQKAKRDQMLVQNRQDSLLKIFGVKNKKFRNVLLNNFQATGKFDANENVTSELFKAAIDGGSEEDDKARAASLASVNTADESEQKPLQDAIFKEIEQGGTGQLAVDSFLAAKTLRQKLPEAELGRQKELEQFKTTQDIRLEKVKAGLKEKEGGKLTLEFKQELTTKIIDQTKPIRKEFGRLSTIFGSLPGLKEQKSGIADFLMIKALQQFFDSPRVTDSEVQMSRQGQGLVNKIRTQVKNVQEGDLISEQLRKDMINSVSVIKVATAKAEEQQLIPFSKRARRNKLNADEIFTPRQLTLLKNKGKVPKFERQGKSIVEILGAGQAQAVKKAVRAGATKQQVEKQLGILFTEDQFLQLK